MGIIQRFFSALLPRKQADDMRRESQEWGFDCAVCTARTSVWDLGGIRWKASGNPRRRLRCVHCGERQWACLERHRS